VINRYLFLLIILIGCQPNKNKLDLNFKIKGLKKGKVTLNKLNDTSFVKIDSFIVNGDKTINFKYHLEEPEILFLDLDVNDGSEARSLSFFAENKTIHITTSLENYGFDIIVKGSINDSLLRDYKSINKKFNDEKLNLFERSFENSRLNNSDSLIIIENQIVNINKRQFLHNANYAVRNSKYELSPYIAITDLIDSKKILDTVYKSLNKEIKNSKYAEQLKKLIN
tara:strand:+ start:324 stop:998 length:675 start_codon:yes stop_codon:yes gene_type:complete